MLQLLPQNSPEAPAPPEELRRNVRLWPRAALVARLFDGHLHLLGVRQPELPRNQGAENKRKLKNRQNQY